MTKRFEETVTSFKDKLPNIDWVQVGRDMISNLWTGMKEWLNKILVGVGEYVAKIKGLFVGTTGDSTGGGSGSSYSAAAERAARRHRAAQGRRQLTARARRRRLVALAAYQACYRSAVARWRDAELWQSCQRGDGRQRLS